MKLAIATLLSTLLFAPFVQADLQPHYKMHWTFVQTTNYHLEEYSTNLDIPLAATLPTAAVNAGWACVREPVVSRDTTAGPRMIGGFWCNNSADYSLAFTAYAECALDKIDTGYSYLTLKLPGAPDGIDFRVSCANF